MDPPFFGTPSSLAVAPNLIALRLPGIEDGGSSLNFVIGLVDESDGFGEYRCVVLG
jgi:hypothetical protein